LRFWYTIEAPHKYIMCLGDEHHSKYLTGVGKSSLVHLLLNGSAVARPAQTIGCAVGVKVCNPVRLDVQP
jgi:hypothetical protein